MAVGLVVVSHSAALADAVAQLARAVSTAELRIALAGGVDDPDHPLGTDASKILAAIESVDGEDGVLVLMDLGSAVLSAELARDLLPEVTRGRVLLCEAPLVEGLVAAAVQASSGADLDRVAAEARAGLSAKVAHLGHAPLSSAPPDPNPPPVDTGGADVHVQLVVTGAHGLHARPAARIVEAVAPLDATVTIRNVTTGGRTAPATSLNGLITLGVRAGHTIEVGAAGSDAERAIAALEALAATNFGDPDGEVPGQITTPRAEAASSSPTDAAAVDGDPDEPGVLRGLGAAPGLAVGQVQLLPTDFGGMPTATRAADEQRGAGGDPEAERRRLQRALEGAATDLATTRRALAVRGGAEAAAIVDAHSMLLVDPALLDPAFAAIAEGAQAEEAWGDAVKAVLAAYRALDDPYLAGRAADVDSVGGEVLARLDGRAAADPGPDPTVAGVLVGQDLTPSAAARLDPARVDAVVTAGGAPTSHAAILARALGIPAVVAVGPAALDLIAGTTVIVDGDRGRVVLDPDAGAMAAASRHIEASAQAAAASRAAGQQPATTRDGISVQVLANAGLAQDAARAQSEGADGIGLLRSELLFLDRATPPGEAEQVAMYRAVCRAIDGKPVVLRTLDIGGDKPVPYVDVADEANPFLGDRGIRLSLARPALLRTQLRAALRVAADQRLQLLLPMVSTVAEIHAARALLAEASRSLVEEDIEAGDVELGVMVEVPALALGIRHVLPHVDFLSIGTNDLTQYVMAAERGNPAVAHLADALEPAVLRLVAEICEAAAGCGTPVAVCGGIAADPEAVPVLLGLGVRELSVPPPAIGVIKDRVRQTDVGRAAGLAQRALGAPDAAAVRALLRSDAFHDAASS